MKIMVNDLLVNYEDEGKGKTVLLLHGWGAELRTFDALAAHLRSHYRVVRIDFPGFGASERPHTDWTVGEYAEFTDAFLKKLKIDSVYAIIAHSFGGRVVLKGVGTDLLSTEKIVLMGSAGVKPPKTLKQSLYFVAAKAGKLVTSLPVLSRLQPRLRRRLYESAGSTDYLESSGMQRIFLNTIDEDLTEYAAKITQPTLLVWGEQDTSTPVSDATLLHSLIRESTLEVLPGAGHFVYADDPIGVTHVIDGFLA